MTVKLPDFAELGEKETANIDNAMKNLAAANLLIGDVHSLYMGITPSVRFPPGDIDTPDQLNVFVTLACDQLMMTQLLYLKSILAVLRRYQSDAMIHLRRAIETCAFTFHMSKHTELCKVWWEAGTDDEKYRAYRKAFSTRNVFPDSASHPDYDPTIADLDNRMDICSKTVHGSVYGIAGHVLTTPAGVNTAKSRSINFFDLPLDMFDRSYFFVLVTHLAILEMYGRIFEPHMTDFAKWKTDYEDIRGRIARHTVTRTTDLNFKG